MMPSTLNFLAPRFSPGAGDDVAFDQAEGIAFGMARAMSRGRQSVRPARVEGEIVLWLVQDVRYVAARVTPHEDAVTITAETPLGRHAAMIRCRDLHDLPDWRSYACCDCLAFYGQPC